MKIQMSLDIEIEVDERFIPQYGRANPKKYMETLIINDLQFMDAARTFNYMVITTDGETDGNTG